MCSSDLDALPADAPCYPVTDHACIGDDGGPAPVVDGLVKTSAAWLIDHAGFAKGYALPGSAASLSTRHVLALTNRGGARAADIAALRDAVVAGVRERYGITLKADTPSRGNARSNDQFASAPAGTRRR